MASIKDDKPGPTAWRVIHFLQELQVPPRYFWLAVFFSAAAATLEGISLSLLIPLLQAIVHQDLGFTRQTMVVATANTYLPALSTLSDGVLFGIIIAITCVASAGKNICRYLSGVSMAFVARLTGHNLRRRIFNTYLSVGKLFFDRHNIGYLNQVLMDYTERVTRPISEGHHLVNALLSFVAYLIIMFTISWKLTVCILVIFPIMNYVQRHLIARIKERSRSLAASMNTFSKATFNTLSSIPLVMSYTNQEVEKEHFAAVSETVAETEYRMHRLQHLIRPIQETIILLTVMLLVVVMAALLTRGQATGAASFLVYFYVVMNAATAYASAQRLQGLLAQADGPLHELQEIVAAQKQYVLIDGHREFKGLQTAITFKHLHFGYRPDQAILTDVSFRIPQGKLTALVGPSGAGKTSLINLLMRYYDAPPGTIFLDDFPIEELTLESLRAHLALVSQDTLLFNDTLRHNITYGRPHVTDEELWTAIKKARLFDFIESLPAGLATMIGDRGVQLSGGEKQRVAIARALLKQADILLLDEATSALDSLTEKLIQEAINEAIVGKTAIVIAHRLSTIQHADNIVVIENGRLVEEGHLSNLLQRRGAFYRYWEEQKFF